MKVVFIIVLILIFLEIIIFNIVKNFKKNFKWIITLEDEHPNFDKERLKKFYINSFDKDLGWDRKKNSRGMEQSDKKTHFTISNKGFRGKKNFKRNLISVFGDSFAFCRYVNNNETWQFFLEKKLKKNILNFGVGNYGLDQSFIKFRRNEKNNNDKIIIFNVVPETIARINSYWKHYREFGNIHGFKPILKIKKDKLTILKVKIKKNFDEKKIHQLIQKIRKDDIFYKQKFLKNIFQFPYCFQLFKNFRIYPLLLFYLSIEKLTRNKNYYSKAVRIILSNNINESHLMYNQKYFKNKLSDLIFFMNNYFIKKKKKMILIITPQLLDLESKNLKYSIDYFRNIKNSINCIDLTSDILMIKNFNKLYLKDIYGGHLNKKGNKIISKIILKKLKNQNII